MVVDKKRGLLEIGTERICSCAENHLSCISAKEWMKSQIGVWQFNYEARDIRDKNLHPATYPISLAKKCISLFTHEGELVLDPFVGSGSTLLAAQDLNRNAVGFDLQQGYLDLSTSRLSQLLLETRTEHIGICDDARNISDHLRPGSVSLILTSPPYANLLNRPRLNKSRRGDQRKNGQYLKTEQYSQDARDLGILDLDGYKAAMGEIFQGLLPLLKIKGHCVIDVPDMWWDNRRVAIHIAVVQALQEVGFELRNTIIWDRTNIVNRIGIFGWPSNYITMGTTFEYLLDFWRPPGKE